MYPTPSAADHGTLAPTPIPRESFGFLRKEDADKFKRMYIALCEAVPIHCLFDMGEWEVAAVQVFADPDLADMEAAESDETARLRDLVILREREKRADEEIIANLTKRLDALRASTDRDRERMLDQEEKWDDREEILRRWCLEDVVVPQGQLPGDADLLRGRMATIRQWVLVDLKRKVDKR